MIPAYMPDTGGGGLAMVAGGELAGGGLAVAAVVGTAAAGYLIYQNRAAIENALGGGRVGDESVVLFATVVPGGGSRAVFAESPPAPIAGCL